MNISSNDVALSGQNCNVFVNRLPPFVECKWRAYHVECPEASLTVYSIHVAWFRVKSLSTMTLQTSSQTQTLVYKFIAQKLFLGNPSVAVCVCSVPLCQSYFAYASASASSPSPSYASASVCATQDKSSSKPF